jgi:glycosyltransferase involved in cell wall biosynthesis
MVVNNKLISLIIPVYNCENFLPKLFASIDRQSNKSFEVIIVDDHSTDNSANLIKAYSKGKENVITHFFNQNKGVSHARNKGAELAKGDYLWFVDGDDYLTDNALEVTIFELEKEKDLDALIFGYNHLDHLYNKLSEKKYTQFEDRLYSGEQVYYQINPAPWNKIFKTSYWKKHEFIFPMGVSIAQDVSITYYAMFKAYKVKVLHSCLYNYCNREFSSVNFYNPHKVKDIFSANQAFFDNFSKDKFSEAVHLKISEISFYSLNYFYTRFKSSFSKKDHLLFLDLFNKFLSTNYIDINSLLSFDIGMKTIVEMDKDRADSHIKNAINIPFNSVQLVKQIE